MEAQTHVRLIRVVRVIQVDRVTQVVRAIRVAGHRRDQTVIRRQVAEPIQEEAIIRHQDESQGVVLRQGRAVIHHQVEEQIQEEQTIHRLQVQVVHQVRAEDRHQVQVILLQAVEANPVVLRVLQPLRDEAAVLRLLHHQGVSRVREGHLTPEIQILTPAEELLQDVVVEGNIER